MPKQRVQYLLVKVRFDKPVGLRAAARLFRDYVPDHLYCSEWDEAAPGEFRIKSVKPSQPLEGGR